MTHWHLAQLNSSMALHPFTDARMAPFVTALNAMYDAADAAPGFIWRPNADTGPQTEVRSYGQERLVLNYLVWRDLDALSAFVYRGLHGSAMRSMAELFEPR